MSDSLGANRLQEALEKCIDYHALEYDISVSEVMGCLDLVKMDLYVAIIRFEQRGK